MEVYFDNAATTSLDPAVFQAMRPYMETGYGNPSSVHGPGRVAKVALEKARKTVARLLQAAPAEIFFTSGGTEGNNWVINSLIEAEQVQHIITSPLEHHSVLEPIVRRAPSKHIQRHWVKLNAMGQVDYEDLERLLQAYQPALVSLMHANNEIGNLNNLATIGSLCRKYKALFHTDAVQTLGYYAWNLAELPVDMLVASAHKFHGPKGVGMVYLHRNVLLQPQLVGGGQERGMRAGTENVPAIVGLAEALLLAQQNLEAIRCHVEAIKRYMVAQLRAYLPAIHFYGACSNFEASLYTLLHVHFPYWEDVEMVLFNLDIQGIAVSAGSACASGSQQKSHIIDTLYPAHEGVSLRFSFSKYNTIAEVDYVIQQLCALQKSH